ERRRGPGGPVRAEADVEGHGHDSTDGVRCGDVYRERTGPVPVRWEGDDRCGRSNPVDSESNLSAWDLRRERLRIPRRVVRQRPESITAVALRPRERKGVRRSSVRADCGRIRPGKSIRTVADI